MALDGIADDGVGVGGLYHVEVAHRDIREDGRLILWAGFGAASSIVHIHPHCCAVDIEASDVLEEHVSDVGPSAALRPEFHRRPGIHADVGECDVAYSGRDLGADREPVSVGAGDVVDVNVLARDAALGLPQAGVAVLSRLDCHTIVA